MDITNAVVKVMRDYKNNRQQTREREKGELQTT